MGLFSLVLLLVPFAIGAVALLLERVETRLASDEKRTAAEITAEVAVASPHDDSDVEITDEDASSTTTTNSTD